MHYLLPVRIQWIWLLILSVIFYCSAAVPYTIIYLIISTLVAYVGSHLFLQKKQMKLVLFVSVAINVILWFVCKGKSFYIKPILWFADNSHTLEIARSINADIIAAMGMGYYTARVIGYILDCYYDISEPQKNPFKLFLFLAFFPQMITGPISRYRNIDELYNGHRFDYHVIASGAQRILWGFVKKLVLADRLSIITKTIWSDTATYNGFYIIIAILLCPLQIYADFSGCMDISLGAAEIFGIKLDENFDNPLLSRTVQEFFQRWHITLGTWAKDYVLYPTLKSKWLNGIKKGTRKFGKRFSKTVSTMIGMGICWFVIGIWHGGWQYIFGTSLIFWSALMLEEYSKDICCAVNKKIGIKDEAFSWHLFQMIRTYLVISLGCIFFDSFSMGIKRIKQALYVLLNRSSWNPWIFFDDSILSFGFTRIEVHVMWLVIILMLLVGILRRNHGYARIWVSKQNLLFRWGIWIGLFLIVLIFGKYGVGYDASDFIYQGF